MTRRIGSPRLQNASVATNTSSETKTASVPATIHGTQAIPSDNITAHTSCATFFCHGSSSPLVIGTVVRGTPVPLYALSCWQVIRGRAAGEGTR